MTRDCILWPVFLMEWWISTLGTPHLLYSMQPAQIWDLLFVPAGSDEVQYNTPLKVNIIWLTYQVTSWPAQVVVNVVLQLRHLRLCNCCSGDEDGTLLLEAHLCEGRKSSCHLHQGTLFMSLCKWDFNKSCLYEGRNLTIQMLKGERVLFTSVESVISLSCFRMSDQDSSHISSSTAGLIKLHISAFFMTQSTADYIC